MIPGSGAYPWQYTAWRSIAITPAMLVELATGFSTKAFEIYKLAPREMVLAVSVVPEEDWSGSGMSQFDLEVGTTIEADLFMPVYELFGTVRAATEFALATPFSMLSIDGEGSIMATITSDINLEDTEAGRTTISLLIGRVP